MKRALRHIRNASLNESALEDLLHDGSAVTSYLPSGKYFIYKHQIGRSGTSIGANIREAQYAHGTADFIAKLQIALKESNETGY